MTKDRGKDFDNLMEQWFDLIDRNTHSASFRDSILQTVEDRLSEMTEEQFDWEVASI